jgi:hypothetical protein
VRPVNKYNANTTSIAAAAGTELTGAFSTLEIIIFRVKDSFTILFITDAVFPVYIFIH